jgi:hypothetical protein
VRTREFFNKTLQWGVSGKKLRPSPWVI